MLVTMADTIIQLNVRGTHYDTTLPTLTKEPDSILGRMFLENLDTVARDAQGRYLIDSDGDLFRYILLYLRHKALPPPHCADAVHKLAEDFGLEGLKQSLEDRFPFIVMKLVRDQFISTNLPDATEHIRQIMQAALAVSRSSLTTLNPTLSPLCLHVSVRGADDSGTLAMDPNHRCHRRWSHPISHDWVSGPVDLMLGHSSVYFEPDLYLNYLCEIMTSKGYSVRKCSADPNSTHCQDSCGRQLFCLELTLLPLSA